MLFFFFPVLLAVVSDSGKTVDIMGETQMGTRKPDRDPQTLMDIYRQKGWSEMSLLHSLMFEKSHSCENLFWSVVVVASSGEGK